MSPNEIKRRFPNASASLLRANAASDPAPSPKPKPRHRHGADGALPGATTNSQRFVVRIIAVRKRLIDPDNLCGKYFVDALRYAGIIVDDAASLMAYSISQKKTQAGEEEHTIIEIEPLIPEAPAGASLATWRESLIEELWSKVSASWNRQAFNAFMETMSEADLQHYIQVGR